MKPKFLNILINSVESGVALGYRRAFKDTDSPKEDHILQTIVAAVMTEIYENFTFEDED